MRTAWAAASVAFAVSSLFGCAKAKELARPAPAPGQLVSWQDAVAGGIVVPLGDAHRGSAVALAKVGGRRVAYVADEDDAVLHVVDADALNEIAVVALPGRPGQVLVVPDGRVFVAVRDASEVVTLPIHPTDLTKLDVADAVRTAAEPVGLATTPDGKELLVASGWGHALSGFDLATLRETFTRSLPREPRAVLTSADGKKAFVSHAVGSTVSVVLLEDPGHAVVDSVVDGWSTSQAPTGDFEEVKRVFDETPPKPTEPPHDLVHRRMACQGFALARVDGPEERVLLPGVQVETGDVTVRSGGYGSAGELGTEMPSIAVLPVETGIALPASMEVFASVRTFGDEADPGETMSNVPQVVFGRRHKRRTNSEPCLLPRAAATARGQVYVACLGINAIVEYDAGVVSPERVEHRRFRVPEGPTGLAVDGDDLFVWSQFARTLARIDLDAPPPARKPGSVDPDDAARDVNVELLSNLSAAPPADGSPEREPLFQVAVARKAVPAATGNVGLGRVLFHAAGDARISMDGRACASCHPDGRDDALTWSTPTGPRQTPMLAGRIEETAPYGWDGEGKDVAMHLGHTFQRLSGRGLEPFELDALLAYLKTLPPPPNAAAHSDPRATSPSYALKLARGSEIFHSEEAHCGSCHAGDSPLTDGLTHDVESKQDADQTADFDTPSLRFVAGTAPYFHDGRYATLRDVLTHTDGTMGKTGHLAPEDLDALEAYVETL